MNKSDLNSYALKNRRGRKDSSFQAQLTSGWISLIMLAAIISIGAGPCNTPALRAIENDVCLACHNGVSAHDVSAFTESIHAKASCEGCHGSGYLHVKNAGLNGRFINSLDDLPRDKANILCAKCHESQVEGFLKSEHAVSEILTCLDCHEVHSANEVKVTHIDNKLCLDCHASLGFDSDESIEAHTFHSVAPEDTGASRCTICHMPPLQRTEQENGPHDHSLLTIEPIRSREAEDAGVIPIPPNTCVGTMGCHDGTVPNTPVFDIDTPGINDALQSIYESRYGTK